MTLVAILTVRKASEDKFRVFESHAAAVMKSHGGRIERTIVVAPDGESDVFKVHLREACVVNTEILIGDRQAS